MKNLIHTFKEFSGEKPTHPVPVSTYRGVSPPPPPVMKTLEISV